MSTSSWSVLVALSCWDLFVSRVVVLQGSLGSVKAWFVSRNIGVLDALLGIHVLEQLWSSGDGMWLFPTLVSLCCVILVRIMVSHLSLCVCWLCSTSLPGGHQVDGLLPAPNMYILEFLPSCMSIATLDICRDFWSTQC